MLAATQKNSTQMLLIQDEAIRKYFEAAAL
jgi:hypothetical protein